MYDANETAAEIEARFNLNRRMEADYLAAVAAYAVVPWAGYVCGRLIMDLEARS